MNTGAKEATLSAADVAGLGDLLGAELDSLEGLSTIIDREHAALLASDAPAIEAIAAEKDRALRMHTLRQRERLDWLSRHALAPATPLAALAAAVPGDTGLDGIVRRLATLASECDVNNRRNGALILRLQQRARNALGVLRGSGDKGDVYSVSGDQEQGSDRRSLGKA